MSVLTSAKSFLTKVGEEFKQGLAAFVKYVPTIIADAAKVEAAAAPVLTLAFPGIAPEISTVTQLIASTALSIEQKFAAQALTGAGTQKLAEVLSIVGPAAESALIKLGVKADEATITSWIDAVVGFLNGVPVAPASAPTQ